MLGISEKSSGESLHAVSISANGAEVCGASWQRLKCWPHAPGGPPLSVIDLFAGCGGITLGIWEAARNANRTLEVKLAIDLNSQAAGVYRDNFSCFSEAVRTEDLKKIFPASLTVPLTAAEKSLNQKIKNLDLLVGGPPCQGHSDLNNSSRRKDPRNSLYFRMVRAAHVFRPKAVIIENVPAVQHDRGRVVTRACNALGNMGYNVSSCVVDIGVLGLAQSRRRHVVLATLKHTPDLEDLMRESRGIPLCLRDVIGDLEEGPGSTIYDAPSRLSAANKARIDHLFDTNLYDLPNQLRPKCHSDRKHSYVSMYGRLSWSKPSQTITSGFGSMGQGRFVHPEFRRPITPHEAARIQGFPDFFSFSSVSQRTALQEIIGNAVPPKLTAIIVSNLIRKKAV